MSVGGGFMLQICDNSTKWCWHTDYYYY